MISLSGNLMRALFVVVAVMSLGFAFAPGAAAQRASLPDIEDEVMCPICGTILEASNSPQAERERDFIRTQIAQGKSKEQIQDALVAEYGPDVLAVPDSKGFDLVAWIVPIVGLLLAACAIGYGLFRLRRKPATDSPAKPVDPATNERIERDIAESDL